jgi:phosphoribosyl-AMP cyclohydrolase
VSAEQFLDLVTFDAQGLVAAIVQDDANGEVLMVAYMNREALTKTVETGRTHFWSRSRRSMWLKGEESGHVQTVRSLAVDCDGDALLVRVEQAVAACHTGYRTCFYRRRTAAGGVETLGERVFDPAQTYRK